MLQFQVFSPAIDMKLTHLRKTITYILLIILLGASVLALAQRLPGRRWVTLAVWAEAAEEEVVAIRLNSSTAIHFQIL